MRDRCTEPCGGRLELGADAVLVNTAIAVSGDPIAMGRAFALACTAGRSAYEAGLGARALQAQASSPLTDFLGRYESACQ